MPKAKPTIALFMSNPAANTVCCNGLKTALGRHYRFQIFSSKTLAEVNFSQIKAVAFPGGRGDADQFDQLVDDATQNAIREFVDRGGAYLGICMGAYWAGHHYFDIVGNTRIKQYINRPRAEIKRSFETTLQVKWKNRATDMFFFDGCAFLGQDFKVIARYQNGDAMAIKQGRIGLIGCHPESKKSWYKKSYLRPYWHDGQHHELLQDFVAGLIR